MQHLFGRHSQRLNAPPLLAALKHRLAAWPWLGFSQPQGGFERFSMAQFFHLEGRCTAYRRCGRPKLLDTRSNLMLRHGEEAQ